MTNKKITDLVELTTPTTDDVFPLVDIATNSTKKAQLANLPISTATQTALDAKQATLVSGTNIKTINSTSLLGSGDISIAANPAGTAGQIQFSDGSAFAADSNLFWDNTNKRLGVGTASPSTILHLKQNTTSQEVNLRFEDNSNIFKVVYQGATTSSSQYIGFTNGSGNTILRSYGTDKIGIGETTTPTARLQVKGSGSTSATTSLLVQNSAGTQLMKLADDNGVVFGGFASLANRARFGTYLQLKYDVPAIDIWQGGTGVGLQITNAGALLAEFNDASFGAIIRHSLIVGSASFASASARLQVDSTTQGFLPPRMTTTQKNAIATPAAGLVVYDSTTNKLCCYNGSTWNDLF